MKKSKKRTNQKLSGVDIAPKKDNTWIYVGIGVSVIGLGVAAYFAFKKSPKDEAVDVIPPKLPASTPFVNPPVVIEPTVVKPPVVIQSTQPSSQSTAPVSPPVATNTNTKDVYTQIYAYNAGLYIGGDVTSKNAKAMIQYVMNWYLNPKIGVDGVWGGQSKSAYTALRNKMTGKNYASWDAGTQKVGFFIKDLIAREKALNYDLSPVTESEIKEYVRRIPTSAVFLS